MKNNKGFAPILIVLIIVGVLVLGGGTYYFSVKKTLKPVACTQEAKICPDGSSVGRVGPNCEFAKCPNIKTGILKGKVSIGPLCPVEPCPITTQNPYSSRMIIIKKQTGQTFLSVPLDADGSFETQIASGSYLLDLSDCTFMGCRYSLPKIIIIEENKTTEINIDIDTGIR